MVAMASLWASKTAVKSWSFLKNVGISGSARIQTRSGQKPSLELINQGYQLQAGMSLEIERLRRVPNFRCLMVTLSFCDNFVQFLFSLIWTNHNLGVVGGIHMWDFSGIKIFKCKSTCLRVQIDILCWFVAGSTIPFVDFASRDGIILLVKSTVQFKSLGWQDCPA